MNKRILLALVASTVLAGNAIAQTDVDGHPRVNEVDQRLDNQQSRVDNGVANGTINAKQEARDDKTDAKVSQEMSADEAKHNGHITKGEQKKMNHQLNKNSKRIHKQKKKAAATAQ